MKLILNKLQCRSVDIDQNAMRYNASLLYTANTEDTENTQDPENGVTPSKQTFYRNRQVNENYISVSSAMINKKYTRSN